MLELEAITALIFSFREAMDEIGVEPEKVTKVLELVNEKLKVKLEEVKNNEI